MAVINKLRKRGWLLIAIVGLTLLLFILQAVIENTNKFGISGKESIGSIDGKEIKISEFDEKYREAIANQEANGQVVSEEQKEQIGSTIWNSFIFKNLISKEYEKSGVTVTQDEATSLLYTNDASPTIKQYFSQNGQFDPAIVINFRNQIMKKNAGGNQQELAMYKKQFEGIVEQVILETKSRKYNSLIIKSIYATKLDAQDDFYNNAEYSTGKIVTLNYATMPDKDFKVTDADLKDYINRHKEEFKQDESRDIEYALWTLNPTKEDTLEVKKQLEIQAASFANAENDSIYVSLNSAIPFDTLYRKHGSYSVGLDAIVNNSPKDSVIGPVYYDGGYSLVKVLDTKADSVYYIHVVKADIMVQGTTKQDTLNAMTIARAIAAESRAYNNGIEFFNQKASQGILQSPYDMGWTQDGNQPPEVNKALKGSNKGEATVVKSLYGISIYKMVEARSNKLVKFAEVRQLIEPLQATKDAAYEKAMQFRNGLTGAKDEYEAATKKANIAKSIAKNVKESDKTISGIKDAKDIIRWLFNEDRKEGDNSDVFSYDDKLIVVNLTKKKKEGTADVEDVREKIEKIVLNEKKAEKLKAYLEKALKTAKSIEDVALGVKSIAQPLEKVSFAMQNAPFAGNDPKVVGFICGSKLKKLSKPFVSLDGVHVAYIESRTKPELPKELAQLQQRVFSEAKQRVDETTFKALKKAGKVKDERYKFY